MPAALKRVLVTCVGSGIGQSVVDSLRYLKDQYYLVGSDLGRFCFSVPDCDDFISLPRIDQPGYIDALLEACKEKGIDAAIPGHDLELALLARHRAHFEGEGIRLIVGSERLVRILRDKRAWSGEFRLHTDRVVPSCTVAEYRLGNPQEVDLPAIAKPLSGSASKGLKIVLNPEDLDDLSDDYLLQPFLFPSDADPESKAIRAAVASRRVIQASEISVQLAYSHDGVMLGRFASRNKLKAGVPVQFIPLDSPEVWNAVEEVSEVLAPYDPSGPVNLQGRMTDDGLVFFEMNPRFTGITGNRALFGFNEVSLLVDNFVQGSRRRLRVNPNKVGVRQVACRAWPRERFQFDSQAGRETNKSGIVVLGGTSWLGRHFVMERAAHNDALVVVCREKSMDMASALFKALPQVEVIGYPSPSLKDCFAWADVLVNCISGRPPHGTSSILEAHVDQMRLLDLAESCDVPLIVNVSSQSVYDLHIPGSSDESSKIDVETPYAFSKYTIEECVRGVSRRRPSVSGVSLRLAQLFGPASGMRREEFPHRVIECAVQDLKLEVKKPSTVLNLLDLRDAVSALSFFLNSGDPKLRGEPFNVGTGKPVTVREYVSLADRICRERFDRPIRVTVHESPGDRLAGLSCNRLASAGWSATVTLEQSVRDLFEYWESH